MVSIKFCSSGYYFGRPSFLEGSGGAVPFGNFEILDSLFLHFEAYFLFCFVVLRSQPIWTNLEKKIKNYSNRFPKDALFVDTKRSIISKFNHRKLALSPANVGKNRYHSTSFVLMLEQNFPRKIVFRLPLVFILSSSFLSISAFQHFSLCFEMLFITRWF